MKTFRFGVNVGPSRSRAEWGEKARKLEDLGYATLTVPDHLTDFYPADLSHHRCPLRHACRGAEVRL
jgi:alkanesulfonate monooxygenase SsuD/methylene tetrahydromethanopterin reductase-like flavin-dependent oxidoreductase (luciferase family)